MKKCKAMSSGESIVETKIVDPYLKQNDHNQIELSESINDNNRYY